MQTRKITIFIVSNNYRPALFIVTQILKSHTNSKIYVIVSRYYVKPHYIFRYDIINSMKIDKIYKNDVLPFCHLVNIEISVTSDIHDFKLLV